MFKKWFKGKEEMKETVLYAPVNGEIVPLEQVPDPVFSEKMMGDGIAIRPSDGEFCSPVDGMVVLIPETKHAIGLKTEDNIEILIHIGLETVSLKGQGFEVLVNAGDKVAVGQPVVKADLTYIREHAKDTITPIVITNNESGKEKIAFSQEKDAIKGKTVLMTFSK